MNAETKRAMLAFVVSFGIGSACIKEIHDLKNVVAEQKSLEVLVQSAPISETQDNNYSSKLLAGLTTSTVILLQSGAYLLKNLYRNN